MGNGIWDFPDCPTLNNVSHIHGQCQLLQLQCTFYVQAFELMCVGEWNDTLLELELLTRIARLALLQGNYHLVGVTM